MANGDKPCPHVVGKTTLYCTLTTFTLTDEEREAVAYYLGTGGPYGVDRALAALLSRTGSDGEKAGDDATECHLQSQKLPERECLTDAEREAIAAGLGALERLYEDSPPISKPIYEQHAPTLRGLLERLK